MTILHDILPRLEAYHERTHRRPHTALTPERAHSLTLLITEDDEIADRAYCDLMFSKPLK